MPHPPTPSRKPEREKYFAPALLTAIALSAWFMVVYGISNHLASQRASVTSWSYDWEQYIPFVPWLIVPYMSIDLFFFFAPFLCDREERRVLAKRIVFSVAVAGIVFLAMPLTLSEPRPMPTDWTAPIFRLLHGFDQPFNMLPSLHITLRAILIAVYARHARGVWKILAHAWFSLIGFSTILVYQHHVVDIVGGFMLAVVAFYLFPQKRTKHDVTPNPRIARKYGIAAAICFALAFVWPWWSLWMLWPALSLAVVASSYVWFGPGVYRKHDGKMPLSAKLLLAPVLLGQRWSWRHYAKQSNAHDVLTDRILIGRWLNNREAQALVADGVVGVIDLTGEFRASMPFTRIAYCNIPISDLTAPTDAQLDQALAFLNEQTRQGKVYIHCKAGYSRTAAVAGAALLAADPTLSADAAIERLKATRRGIVIRPEIVDCLHRFANRQRRGAPLNLPVDSDLMSD